MTSETSCEVRTILSRRLRAAFQGYLETAQLLDAAHGNEVDHAYQTAENAMLKVTKAHEQLVEHIATHQCRDAQSTTSVIPARVQRRKDPVTDDPTVHRQKGLSK